MQHVFTFNQQPEALQSVFLQRLQRLLTLERVLMPHQPERALIVQALTSTYWDCCQLGARQDARELMNLRDR